MRKIIQLIGTGGVTDSFRAFCDDGSLWQIVGDTWRRVPLPAIPQETPGFTPFNASDYLSDCQSIVGYLKAIRENPETDLDLLKVAVDDVIKALQRSRNELDATPSGSDANFLTWLHARLQFQHREDPSVDYMHKLRSIILAMPKDKNTRNLSSSVGDLPKIRVKILPIEGDYGYYIAPVDTIPGWVRCAYPTYELARKRIDDDPGLELVE